MALRDEYIAEMSVASAVPKEADGEDNVIDFDKEVLKGEMV